MSSCLVLQTKDKLYIGADTSSSVFIGEKLYRLNNNTKKLFLLNGNTVLYCAGNNSIAEKVVQYISSTYRRNDFSLISLKNWLIEMYPYKNKDKTVYDVEILIATFKNNRTIVYQMSQYKNYDIISFEVSDVGVQILSAGIKNAECMSFAENELINKSGVKSIFRATFNNLSCNYIGGYLDLYEISKSGVIKIFDNEKINEHGIQYVNDIFNSLSVSLNAEVLVSKLVMSENLWIENNSGTYKFDDNGFTASNGVNTVKIQPNNSGELFSIYKGSSKQVYINSDGDVEFAGSLKSASGQFAGLVSGGSIDIGNGVFTVDKDGSLYASSGQFAGLVSGGSININDKFKVDKDGNVEATSGKFSVDITGSRGVFNGSINAKKITISRDNKDGLGSVDIRSGFGSFEPSSGTGSFSDVAGDSPAVEMYCSKNGQFASTMLTNNAYVIMAQNIALNGDITCHGIDILNAKNFTDIIKSMHMNAMYESSSYGYGTDSLISFRQYYDSKSYHYHDKDYCATTAKYVHEYVKAKIPNTSNFATKSDLSGHNHTITPTKISPSSGSGTHNFMYNFSTYSGTNGFSYTYGYASGSLSDKRLKENIRPIEDISDKYMQLVPIQFNFHEDIGCVFKGIHFGFIAQDVEKIFDDDKLAIICREHQEDEIANNYLNGDDAYVLDKDELHALHVQMIQKHQREIESLQCKIKELERKIS